jgi:hypothetical protein
MTYRDGNVVLEERLADVQRHLAAAVAIEHRLTGECDESSRAVKDLEARLALCGVGGAARGPTFDRINLLVAGLCVVGLLVVPAEIYIGGYVRRQPEETVVPMLLLAGPGVLAAVIAWPYRTLAPYGKGVLLGLVLALSAVLNVVAGIWR